MYFSNKLSYTRLYGSVRVCACVSACVCVWGMSPELCGELAIHRPPLHNGQTHNHAARPWTDSWNVKVPRPPLPTPTYWEHKCLPPLLLFLGPDSGGGSNNWGGSGETVKGMSYRWRRGSGSSADGVQQWKLLREGRPAASHKFYTRLILVLDFSSQKIVTDFWKSNIWMHQVND